MFWLTLESVKCPTVETIAIRIAIVGNIDKLMASSSRGDATVRIPS